MRWPLAWRSTVEAAQAREKEARDEVVFYRQALATARRSH